MKNIMKNRMMKFPNNIENNIVNTEEAYRFFGSFAAPENCCCLCCYDDTGDGLFCM